ncbi:hypothetical protein [Streptomyces tsukubensis]|uniref:hypothetical protein n=1 Tax=Streptomyces tsukubensis TaxID=83656 RepID=UPI00117FD1B9|nr:hypothetical protein [Streptomyces tsukubensis]QFR95337.1 hypothetical protein GBW32_22810 [Streptomyces tsukubensis]
MNVFQSFPDESGALTVKEAEERKAERRASSVERRASSVERRAAEVPAFRRSGVPAFRRVGNEKGAARTVP